MPISVGEQAPEFTLVDEKGSEHSLSDYSGKPVVLYFYPKDDTPGCTKQACGFRDDYSTFQEAGVTILGVSPDSSKSHTRFINKYDLPFTLLADTDRQVIDLYEVWGLKVNFGPAPAAIATIMVSPMAREIETIKAAVIPESAAGRTTLIAVSSLVAPMP